MIYSVYNKNIVTWLKPNTWNFDIVNDLWLGLCILYIYSQDFGWCYGSIYGLLLKFPSYCQNLHSCKHEADHIILSFFWRFLQVSYQQRLPPAPWHVLSSKQPSHPQAVEPSLLSSLRSYITSYIIPSGSHFSVMITTSYTREGLYIGQCTRA